ncbi:hypothetical protein L596_002433 [Steinernema carpocapsae]|uniref:Uncharacterized protein n=1 Tax=Steinernema carpocapsae TaxID=34508 RepID=A0A4U8UQ92_STECR|nr:hypothetical protein L596_002433 [Steinernema carpocapsae]
MDPSVFNRVFRRKKEKKSKRSQTQITSCISASHGKRKPATEKSDRAESKVSDVREAFSEAKQMRKAEVASGGQFQANASQWPRPVVALTPAFKPSLSRQGSTSVAESTEMTEPGLASTSIPESAPAAVLQPSSVVSLPPIRPTVVSDKMIEFGAQPSEVPPVSQASLSRQPSSLSTTSGKMTEPIEHPSEAPQFVAQQLLSRQPSSLFTPSGKMTESLSEPAPVQATQLSLSCQPSSLSAVSSEMITMDVPLVKQLGDEVGAPVERRSIDSDSEPFVSKSFHSSTSSLLDDVELFQMSVDTQTDPTITIDRSMSHVPETEDQEPQTDITNAEPPRSSSIQTTLSMLEQHLNDKETWCSVPLAEEGVQCGSPLPGESAPICTAHGETQTVFDCADQEIQASQEASDQEIQVVRQTNSVEVEAVCVMTNAEVQPEKRDGVHQSVQAEVEQTEREVHAVTSSQNVETQMEIVESTSNEVQACVDSSHADIQAGREYVEAETQSDAAEEEDEFYVYPERTGVFDASQLWQDFDYGNDDGAAVEEAKEDNVEVSGEDEKAGVDWPPETVSVGVQTDLKSSKPSRHARVNASMKISAKRRLLGAHKKSRWILNMGQYMKGLRKFSSLKTSLKSDKAGPSHAQMGSQPSITYAAFVTSSRDGTRKTHLKTSKAKVKEIVSAKTSHLEHFTQTIEGTLAPPESASEVTQTNEKWLQDLVNNLDQLRKKTLQDVGIQTGVLARVQHLYGDSRNKKTLTISDTPGPSGESQKIMLKKGGSHDTLGIGSPTQTYDHSSLLSTRSLQEVEAAKWSSKPIRNVEPQSPSHTVTSRNWERQQTVADLRSRIEGIKGNVQKSESATEIDRSHDNKSPSER